MSADVLGMREQEGGSQYPQVRRGSEAPFDGLASYADFARRLEIVDAEALIVPDPGLPCELPDFRCLAGQAGAAGEMAERSRQIAALR